MADDHAAADWPTPMTVESGHRDTWAGLDRELAERQHARQVAWLARRERVQALRAELAAARDAGLQLRHARRLQRAAAQRAEQERPHEEDE
jgi:hypothetical protein